MPGTVPRQSKPESHIGLPLKTLYPTPARLFVLSGTLHAALIIYLFQHGLTPFSDSTLLLALVFGALPLVGFGLVFQLFHARHGRTSIPTTSWGSTGLLAFVGTGMLELTATHLGHAWFWTGSLILLLAWLLALRSIWHVVEGITGRACCEKRTLSLLVTWLLTMLAGLLMMKTGFMSDSLGPFLVIVPQMIWIAIAFPLIVDMVVSRKGQDTGNCRIVCRG